MPYIPPEVVAQAREMDLLTPICGIMSRRSWCISGAAPTAPVSTTA